MTTTETKQKKTEIIISFDVRDDKTNNVSDGKHPFLMKYWLDKVFFNGEEKSRYLFFKEDSLIRKKYEDILKNYTICWGNTRFEGHLCYVLLKQ